MVVWAFLGFNAGALLEYNYSETAVVVSSLKAIKTATPNPKPDAQNPEPCP